MTHPATEAARKEMWIEYSVSGGWIFYASLEGETGIEAYRRAKEIAPEAQIFAVYASKKRNDSPHPDTATSRKLLYATATAFEVERRVRTKPRPSNGREFAPKHESGASGKTRGMCYQASLVLQEWEAQAKQQGKEWNTSSYEVEIC